MPIIRVYNPHRPKRKKHGKRRARRNPVPGGVLTFMANKHKHHRRTKRRNRKGGSVLLGNRHRARRRNPVFHVRRRRRNPVGLGDFKQLATSAGAAIAGGVLTRTIPETVLPTQNKGILGYGLNVASALLLGMGAGKFFGDAIGAAVTLGGFVMTAGRVIDDYTPWKGLVEFGTFPGLSGDRKYALGGEYRDINFPLPQSSLIGGRLPVPVAALPAAPNGNAAAVVASLSRKGGRGVGGGYGRGGWN